MALFVLGAGATRGCSFVDPKDSPCIPPLDKDFFTQLQRIPHKKHQNLISNVIKDVTKIFGLNFETTMENMFTTVEHTRKMVGITGDSRDFRKYELNQISERLKQAIAAVLESSLCEENARSRRQPKPCDHHSRLVRNILKPGDTIISFNYDCVLDHTLKSEGSHKWNARYGYGFQLGPRGTLLTGDKFWQPNIPSTKEQTIKLLKLHGSLHFKLDDLDVAKPNIELKERPYTRQKHPLKFTIIPPEWHKRFDKGAFRHLWSLASDAIYDAKEIVFIGYSLPPTDLHSTALFRTSIRSGGINSIVVANPAQDARKRTRGVVQRGITNDSRIISCDSLAEFVSMERSVWDKSAS